MKEVDAMAFYSAMIDHEARVLDMATSKKSLVIRYVAGSVDLIVGRKVCEPGGKTTYNIL